MVNEPGDYTPEQLRRFWLQTVAKFGWQTENPSTIPMAKTSAALSPHKAIIAVDPGWPSLVYLDGWWEGPGFDFFGQTMIQRIKDGVILWQMSYRGWMNEEAEPIVKNAIAKAVEEGLFCGGRGQNHETVRNGRTFLYRNSYLGTFRRFNGSEEVYCLGEHNSLIWVARVVYSGGVLGDRKSDI